MLVTCVLLCGFVSICSELAGSKAAGRPVKKLLGVIKVKMVVVWIWVVTVG